MDISLYTLWLNSNQYIKSKISDGLSPLEKKVAMVAIAYFSLATLGYFLYRCVWRTSTEKVSNRNANPHVRAPHLRDIKAEGKDKATLATAEVVKVQDSSDQLSAAQIAIQNADQLRSILDCYEKETLNPSGQERILYLDVQGQFQGIGRQNDSPMWFNEKQPFAYEIKIRMQKYQWEPSKQPAFERLASLQWGKSIPYPIVAIVDATLHELNQLASGSFQMAKKLFPNDPPDETRWLTIFSDPDAHSSAALLAEANASEEAPKKTHVDFLPSPNHKPEEDEEDALYNDVVEDLPKKTPLDDLLTPNHKSRVDEDDYLYNDVLEDLPQKTPVDALPTPDDLPQVIDKDFLAFKDLIKKIYDDQSKKEYQDLYDIDDLDDKLTSDGIRKLKGMPLTRLDFSACDKLTDQALDHLKGMPLIKLDLSACNKLTELP